jgi:hypothetical protein
MKQYVPVEPTVNAAQVSTLTVVTTAILDDGNSVVVPNDAVVGDFVIQNADGSFKFDAKADFDAKYKAA